MDYKLLILDWIISTPGALGKCDNEIRAFSGKDVDGTTFSVKMPGKYQPLDANETFKLPDDILENICKDLGLVTEITISEEKVTEVIELIEELNLGVKDIQSTIQFIMVQTGLSSMQVLDIVTDYFAKKGIV